MGLLNLFNRHSNRDVPLRLPSGSFTVDRHGKVLASTLPASFPVDKVQQIADLYLRCFRGAEESNISMSEVVVEFSGLKFTGKSLRGGAIIFLSPRSLDKPRH